MNSISNKIQIKIHDSVFNKDPETSKLGLKIIEGSIDLIDSLGFEMFTFKKLATHISSSEASVYRYFESKHHVLVYLASWYWSTKEYKLVIGLANIDSPQERLKKAIKLLTCFDYSSQNYNHIDENKLNRIVIREFSKIYLNKNVDTDNKEGYFMPYKEVVQRASDIVLEINPAFKYPHMLISTVIEGAHHQHFFAEHLPRLTNKIKGEDTITEFYLDLVFKSIETK